MPRPTPEPSLMAKSCKHLSTLTPNSSSDFLIVAVSGCLSDDIFHSFSSFNIVKLLNLNIESKYIYENQKEYRILLAAIKKNALQHRKRKRERRLLFATL